MRRSSSKKEMREAKSKPAAMAKTASVRKIPLTASFRGGAACPWKTGADLIDSLLEPDSRLAKLLRPEEARGLQGIRLLLIEAHIQQNIIPAELKTSDNPINRGIAEQFGGVRPKSDMKKMTKSILNGLKFIKTAQLQMSAKDKSARRITQNHKAYLPPEFQRLSTSRQNYLYGRLTYDALSLWGYDALELSISCGGAPLMFVGWSIICAPYAQIAMAEVSDGKAVRCCFSEQNDPITV